MRDAVHDGKHLDAVRDTRRMVTVLHATSMSETVDRGHVGSAGGAPEPSGGEVAPVALSLLLAMHGGGEMTACRERLSDQALWRAYQALLRDGHPGIQKSSRDGGPTAMSDEPYRGFYFEQIDRLRGLMTDATLRLALRALARQRHAEWNNGGQ